MSQLEKLRSTNFYHAYATGDLNKRIEVLMLLARTNPRDRTAHNELALTHLWLGQFDQALAQAREAISNNRNFAPAHRALAWALLRLNGFPEAKDVITQALQQKLDHPAFYTFLYQMAFINGDASGMQQQLDWASGKPYKYIAFDWQAGAAAFSGQWRRAQEQARRAIDLAARDDTKEVAAGYASEQALRLAVLSSNFSLPSSENRKLKLELQTLAQTALDLARGRASLPRVALALALCGQTEHAKPLVDELTKRYPEDTIISSIWLSVIRAAIELQRLHPSGVPIAMSHWPVVSLTLDHRLMAGKSPALPWQAGKPALHSFTGPVKANKPSIRCPPGLLDLCQGFRSILRQDLTGRF